MVTLVSVEPNITNGWFIHGHERLRRRALWLSCTTKPLWWWLATGSRHLECRPWEMRSWPCCGNRWHRPFVLCFPAVDYS